MYSINFFLIQIIWFFSKKFRYICKQTKRLGALERKSINNQKLARTILEQIKVEQEVMEINEFFREFVGFSLVHFFLFSVLLAFIVLYTSDWKLKTVLGWIVLVMHLGNFGLPKVTCPVRRDRLTFALLSSGHCLAFRVCGSTAEPGTIAS